MGEPFRHGCRLTLTARDGRVFKHERLARRGSPDNPVGEAEIVRKFDANVRATLSRQAAADLRLQAMRLDRPGDMRNLVARLTQTVDRRL
jgi:hypothetical protein